MATRTRRTHNARSEVAKNSRWKPFVISDRRSSLVTVLETPAPEAERAYVRSVTGRRYFMSITSLLDGYQLADTPGPANEIPNELRKLPPPSAPTDDSHDPVHAPAPATVVEPSAETAPTMIPETAVTVRVIDGWRLSFTGDDEPLIRDIDLGERLGFERPRDVRKLLDRLVLVGKLNGSELRAIVAQTSGRPARELWLTEEQALLVVTASETPKAMVLTREIVRVFMAARRGALLTLPSAPPPANDPRIDRLVGAVEQLVGLVAKVVEAGVLGRAAPPPAAAPTPIPPPPPSGTQRLATVAPKGWMGAREMATWLSGRLQSHVSEKRVNKVIAALKMRERTPVVATRIRTTRVDGLGDTHSHPKWTYAPSILRELEVKLREGMSGPLFNRDRASTGAPS